MYYHYTQPKSKCLDIHNLEKSRNAAHIQFYLPVI